MAAATSGTGNVGTEEITRTPFFIAVVMIVYHLTHQLSSGRRPGSYTPQKPTTRRPSAAAPGSATSPVTHGGRTADLTGQASPPAAIPTGLRRWPLARRALSLATTQKPRANDRNTAFSTYLHIGSAPAGTGARKPASVRATSAPQARPVGWTTPQSWERASHSTLAEVVTTTAHRAAKPAQVGGASSHAKRPTNPPAKDRFHPGVHFRGRGARGRPIGLKAISTSAAATPVTDTTWAVLGT